MKSKMIEGYNNQGLYLKAVVCVFEEHEWQRRSLAAAQVGTDIGLLRQESWTSNDFFILDLSRPGPGGKFTMGKTDHDARWALDKLPVRF